MCVTSWKKNQGHIYRYDVLSLATFGDDVPIDGVDVAEHRVLLESYGAAQNIGERIKTDFLQMHHLECHESVIDEERMPANHRQVRKYMADALQTAYYESIAGAKLAGV